MKIQSNRPKLGDYFIQMARQVATRSTCRHRNQGAVIVRDRRVISTGYNGAPPGAEHCIDKGYCAKAEGLPCVAEGLHGESNAIASAARMGVSTLGAAIYCVYSPCRSCCNLICSAGITKVVFSEVYDGFVDGPEYLKSLGIEVLRGEG